MTAREKLLIKAAILAFIADGEEDVGGWEAGMDILGNYILNSLGGKIDV